MSIQTITPADTAVLAELHRLSINSAWQKNEFEELLRNPFYGGWLAFSDAQPAGFILGSFIRPDAEILTFAVLPHRRRQGIGTTLLTHLRHYCLTHGFTKTFLEVDLANTQAKQLYLSQDFKKIGIRKNYYEHPSGESSHALVMSLAL